mgnify:CR=1 FL=1
MAIKSISGIGHEGLTVKGWSVTATGINKLVKMAKNMDELPNRMGYKFRALNQRLKPVFKKLLIHHLQRSCDEKGKISRPKGHKWIRNSLNVIPGGMGRGVSALRVIITDRNVAKFAHIYDVGGTIHPISSKYLALPTFQFQKGTSNGLPMSWDRDKTPREQLDALKAKGYSTMAIPIGGTGAKMVETDAPQVSIASGSAHISKLIVARIKNKMGVNQAVRNVVKEKFPNAKGFQKGLQTKQQVGVYLLADWVKVLPSHWARDGVLRFITDSALPSIRTESKVVLDEFRQGLKA